MKTICLTSMLAFLVLVSCKAEELKGKRPANWGVKVTKPNLENLYKITPNFYRCAQPSADGMKAAENLGIKTVINLRHNHTDKDEAKGTNLKLVHIPINTWHMKDKYVIKFLETVTDPEQQPVLLHCKHGSDRTGTMVAMYRICVEGWTKENAIKEMKKGGYGYHKIWRNLIKYIEKVDVAKIKKEAGIASSAEQK